MEQATPGRRIFIISRKVLPSLDGWSFTAWVIAALVILPIAVVVHSLLVPTPDVWRHLWKTRLPEMLFNTLVLVLGVGTGALILGTGLAWLVTAYRFPGRAFFEWALVLPMAMPSYVLAYVFMAIFDYAGPVQKTIRLWLGSSHWFPSIRSGGGTILVMVLTFYPYVYLLARAAFQEQAALTFEIARTLGASRTEAFRRVVLPMSRPSLVAGTSLVIMEVLTDVGTVRFLNFPTLSDGIFRVWHGMMNREAATQLAGLLLLFAFGAMVLERQLRGRARYVQEHRHGHGIPPRPLAGWRGWAATAIGGTILGMAFLLPASQLVVWSIQEIARSEPGTLDRIYWHYVRNSWVLAFTTALLAVLVAVILAYGVHLNRKPLTRLAARAATLGYAIPGAVIGLGILLPLSRLDHTLNALTRQTWGITVGLVFTGTIVGLLYAYVVRFMAVAYSSVEASLEKVSPNLEGAARTLGATPRQVLQRIHLPLMRVGVLTGATLVFVDVMKELPITLLLRPFGYNTLALWVWQDVSESLWESASLPALTIVLVGLIPVILLIRSATFRR